MSTAVGSPENEEDDEKEMKHAGDEEKQWEHERKSTLKGKGS